MKIIKGNIHYVGNNSPKTNGEMDLFSYLVEDHGCVDIFDVGANTDCYYIEVKRKLCYHLFEPVKKRFVELERNVLNISGTKTVTLNNFGLSNIDEKCATYFKNSGGLFKNPAYKNLKKINITITTLDKYCKKNNVDNIDFLKIDTEGSECNILLGGMESIRKFKPFIQFEYCKTTKEMAGVTLTDFFMLLEPEGYYFYYISHKGLTHTPEPVEGLTWSNFLASPIELEDDKEMIECDHLPAGRKRICNGSSGLPLEKVNEYREKWDIEPLGELPETSFTHMNMVDHNFSQYKCNQCGDKTTSINVPRKCIACGVKPKEIKSLIDNLDVYKEEKDRLKTIFSDLLDDIFSSKIRLDSNVNNGSENDRKYLFLLCFPGDGSSVLWHVISRNSNCIYFKPEGQQLYHKSGPIHSDYPSLEESIIRDKTRYNWDKIKGVWNREWSKRKDLNKIKLEDRIYLQKSPIDIFRADMLMEEFKGVRFILMTRDPYASIEGKFRKSHTQKDIEASLELWDRVAKLQLQLNKLDNVIHVRFEDICTNNNVEEKIRTFMPELNNFSIDPNSKFSHAHLASSAKTAIPISNGIILNDKSYNNLLRLKHLDKINSTLYKNVEWLETFGYEIKISSTQYERLIKG